jgi:hypothetical protein
LWAGLIWLRRGPGAFLFEEVQKLSGSVEARVSWSTEELVSEQLLGVRRLIS